MSGRMVMSSRWNCIPCDATHPYFCWVCEGDNLMKDPTSGLGTLAGSSGLGTLAGRGPQLPRRSTETTRQVVRSTTVVVVWKSVVISLVSTAEDSWVVWG